MGRRGRISVLVAGGGSALSEPIDQDHRDLPARRTPAIAERITSQGGVVVADSPQEFAAFIRSEIPRWAQVIKVAEISINT
jgi:hypothetical protein